MKEIHPNPAVHAAHLALMAFDCEGDGKFDEAVNTLIAAATQYGRELVLSSADYGGWVQEQPSEVPDEEELEHEPYDDLARNFLGYPSNEGGWG